MKFLQDDYGMFRHKNLYRWKDFLFRLSRNEGNVIIHIIAPFLLIAVRDGDNPDRFAIEEHVLRPGVHSAEEDRGGEGAQAKGRGRPGDPLL